MKKIIVISLVCSLLPAAEASWYWPFGADKPQSGENSSSKDGEKEEKRLSELMEPASMAIDDATDLADSGKISEAIAKYREAIKELDRIEMENPERAKTSEFSSLRTKRAYTRSAIASLQMKEALDNAKPVSVTDTTALERKLEEEKAAIAKARDEARKRREESKDGGKKKDAPEKADKPVVGLLGEMVMPQDIAKTSPADGSADGKAGSSSVRSLRDAAIADMRRKDFASAHKVIAGMLKENPDDALALNLLAAAYAGEGKSKESEDALFRCIKANPRGYSAYYNMARLYLKKSPPDRSGAKRYYDTALSLGGERDVDLERAMK